MFSPSGDTLSTSGGGRDLEYNGECSVHRRDIMIHVGGYYDYIGECSVNRGGVSCISIFGGGCSVHCRDIMTTSGGYYDSC